MKINAKTNLKVRKITTIVLFLAVAIITIILIAVNTWPKTITVNSDTALIRLPGEYEGRAKVYYNAEYVTQERENTTIRLYFEKQGYYLVKIDDENYIFEVLNFDNSDYTVDMVSKELPDIKAAVVLAIILISVGTIVGEVLIVSFVKLYVTSKISRRNKKERRVE